MAETTTTTTIDMISLDGTIVKGTAIPDDMTVREIIGEFADQLGYQWSSADGRPVTFILKWENQNQTLREDQTLPQAGVQNGHVLRLLSSEPTSTGGGTGTTIHRETGPTVDVRLSPRGDLNEFFPETLRTDVLVSDLVQSLRKKYSISEINPRTNNPWEFKLKSKALGRLLTPDQTLASAGVPKGDSLVMLMDAIPGLIYVI
jgi:uncharacterized ubiquitin-like protein YukD